jgi:hypothetical protein
VLRVNLRWKLVSRLVGSCLALLLAIGMTSCEKAPTTTDNPAEIVSTDRTLTATDGPLSEVNTPASIAKLAPSLEKYHPQVQILSPKPDENLTDDRVTVKLKVTDLPLFKNPELGLGNHLHIILDKQTYQGVYDLSQPLVFKNLAAGTHTLRVFASRPWHESFKNEGAFAQVKFHVLTQTAENNPDPQQPLLTFSRPAGTYGAEPIMLDYYLTNVPSHLAAQGGTDRLPDWRVRVTINDQRFILDRWVPVYLQGFKQGKNWVRLELVDDRGNPIPNVYNDNLAIFTYDPQAKDTLAQLIRGELNADLAQTLVDPDYVAIAPAPIPTPVNTPIPLPTPSVPNPIAISPPVIQPSSSPLPAPIVKTIPTTEPERSARAEGATSREQSLDSSDRPQIGAHPTVTPNIQPSSIPTSTPQPANPMAKSPAVTPAPESPSNPRPVITPPPSIAPMPPTIANLPPPAKVENNSADRIPVVIAAPQRQIPTPSMPEPVESQERERTSTPAASPQSVATEKTWQTQAIEISNLVKAKIRVFTNTIPAKAQRFGHNLQIWYGKASDLIQALRDRKNLG